MEVAHNNTLPTDLLWLQAITNTCAHCAENGNNIFYYNKYNYSHAF